jgi:2'-hydroxyisoflavone reductase
MPLWVPSADETFRYIEQVSVRKAVDAGLTFRPLADTVRDTLAWASTRPADREPRAGLSAEREAEVLHGVKG